MEGYRTKIIGWSMFAIAVLHFIVDIIDGGDFNLNTHYLEIYGALTGLGFVYLRKNQDKIQESIDEKK